MFIKNLRTGLVILLLITVAAAALTDELPILHAHYVAPRIIIAALASGGAVAFILFTHGAARTQGTELGSPLWLQVADNETEVAREIGGAYARATQMYGEATLNLFFNILGDLPQYLVRIDEDIQTVNDVSRIQIGTREQFFVDGGSPETLLLPLAKVEKGVLLDNFKATDGNGGRIALLSDSQRRGILAIMLEVLVDTALREDLSKRAIRDVQATRSRVLRELTLAVCGPGPRHLLDRKQAEPCTSPQQIIAKKEADRIDNALGAIRDLRLSCRWQQELELFCRQQIDYYIIIAEVKRCDPQCNYITASYVQYVPLEHVSGDKLNAWRGRFGMSPWAIDVPLNVSAFEVQCYHQQFVAEPGQYVFDHRLEQLSSHRTVTQDDMQVEDCKPYVRVYHDDNRPNAHLYIRRQILASPTAERRLAQTSPTAEAGQRVSKLSLEQLKSVIQLREIPPGAIGAATMLALIGAVVISFFALTHLGMGINPNAPTSQLQREQLKATLNSDVPALLLALPAFAGILTGSWLDFRHLRLSSLTIYLALCFTMTLSLVSALYFILDSNRLLPTAVTISIIGGAKVTTDWIWLVLMAVSVTHFGFLLHMLLDETHCYRARSRERVDIEVG